MGRRLLYALALFVVWTIPGLLAASITAAFFPVSFRRFGAPVYFASTIVVWWVWPVLTPAIAWVTRRFPLERDRLARSLPTHLAAALVCSLIYTSGFAVTAMAIRPASEPPEEFVTLVRGFLGSRLALGMMLYAAVVGVVIAVDERARRRQRELDTVRLEAELSRAQLQALQMQLQPHFLFNTLHAVAMLIEENPRAAARTITLLGDLLRQTLALADIPEVPLREELEILRRYLEIEQIRFGDRLTVVIDVAADAMAVPVPSFLLQPLVENAVRHGVAPRVEPGRVVVRVRRDGAALTIAVEDDGAGFAAAAPRDPGGGIGLAATRERLAVLYADRARLVCDDAPDGGARVTVTLPIANA